MKPLHCLHFQSQTPKSAHGVGRVSLRSSNRLTKGWTCPSDIQRDLGLKRDQYILNKYLQQWLSTQICTAVYLNVTYWCKYASVVYLKRPCNAHLCIWSMWMADSVTLCSDVLILFPYRVINSSWLLLLLNLSTWHLWRGS